MKEHAGGPPASAKLRHKIPVSFSPSEEFDVEIHPTVDFDWDAIEADNQAEARAQGQTFAKVVLGQILDWIFNGGKATPEGVMLRAYVVGWAFLPYFAGLRQKDVGKLMGKRKQSIGRPASEFRDRFKMILPFMQSEEARATCRQREKTKRLNGNNDRTPARTASPLATDHRQLSLSDGQSTPST